jgi:signal transduction histidine kinase
MPGFFERLFASDGFMPHGHCYLWNPGLVWLNVLSDALTALAYTSIPFTLVYFARKRKDLPFNWMFVCFGVFIIACGATHYMEIWTLWTPTYWLAGAIKAITAAASVPTAILLARLVPKALAIPTAAQLAKANHDLAERTAQLQVTNLELEAFSYSVAHDLRAPLRGMDGFAHALLDEYRDKLDAQGRDYLEEIRANASRMGQLIDALLSLSHVTRSESKAEAVDLTTLGRRVADQLVAADPRRRVDMVVGPDLHAEIDPQLARTLLENLMSNSWKFTGKSGSPRIELGAFDENGGRTFFVRDNGVGFDMAFADKLFAPFQRLHAGSEFPGTGIGLATALRIVKRHGGRIWGEGAVGAGATFYFTLPAAI